MEQAAAITGGENRRLNGVEFLRFMELLPIPLIASVHGVCLGGGLELALSCDYIIAASSAKIGSVEATLGLHPLLGGIQRQVQRIGAQRAKEMSMLARRYDAPTLEKWGLINLTVPEESLEKATMAIAEEFAQGPTVAHAATKELAHIAVNRGRGRRRRGDGTGTGADLGVGRPEDRSCLVPQERPGPRKVRGALT